MKLKKFGFTVLLTVFTAIAIVLSSGAFTELRSQTVSNSNTSPTALMEAAEADFQQGNYQDAERKLQTALAYYCTESGLHWPTPLVANLNVPDAGAICNKFPTDNSSSIHQIATQLRITRSDSFRQYNLPLEMAEIFKRLGDIYLRVGSLHQGELSRWAVINLASSITYYKAATDIFAYQNFFTQKLINETTGEYNCRTNRYFSGYLKSLYEIAKNSFEHYKLNNRLSSDQQQETLKLALETLEIALQRMTVFSFEPAQAGTYMDGSSGVGFNQTIFRGDVWSIRVTGGIGFSPNLSGDPNNHLDTTRRENVSERLQGQAARRETFSEEATCIVLRQPELEDRVAGLLQQALLEKYNAQGDEAALWKAYRISDLGRTLGVDQYVAYNLEATNQTTEKDLIKDLSTNLSLEKVSQIANQTNEVIVSYSIISDEQLAIWAVHPTTETGENSARVSFNCRQKLASIGVETGSEQSCTEILRQLIQPESTPDGRGQTRAKVEVLRSESDRQVFYSPETLRTLYRLLIEPIEQYLPTDENQHVVFVPYGSLYFAPFAALLDENCKPLIESHTIRFAPNLRTLVLNYQNRKQNILNGRNAVVVGNPSMPLMQTSEQEEVSEEQRLVPLPYSELESVNIAELLRQKGFNVTRLTRDQAIEETVVQKMERSNIIHLATHGVIEDNSNPENQSTSSSFDVVGKIALAPTETNNGWLTALDLIKVGLNDTDLVVLSACDTAQGKLIPGGVIGLPFALSLSGVQSIVASIWAIPDSPATVELMKNFYEQILQNDQVDIAQALRQAMIHTKNKPEYSDPRYWAGFTLIGTAR